METVTGRTLKPNAGKLSGGGAGQRESVSITGKLAGHNLNSDTAGSDAGGAVVPRHAGVDQKFCRTYESSLTDLNTPTCLSPALELRHDGQKGCREQWSSHQSKPKQQKSADNMLSVPGISSRRRCFCRRGGATRKKTGRFLEAAKLGNVFKSALCSHDRISANKLSHS